MNDLFVSLVPIYGLWLIGAVTFLSCLAVPVPSSLLMLAGGAFAATGDLALASVVGVAVFGAIAGDQVGYAIGKSGRSLLSGAQTPSNQRELLMQRARNFSEKWGGMGVFLSRWLVSPLGPYVNYISGASDLRWLRFTSAGIAGELVWVSLYTGLGFAFGGEIDMVADIAGNISGTLAAAAVAVFFGGMVFRANHRDPARGRRGRQV